MHFRLTPVKAVWRSERLLVAERNGMDSSSPKRHLGTTLVSDMINYEMYDFVGRFH